METMQGNNWYASINRETGSYNYRVGSMLGSGTLYTTHRGPLNDKDANAIIAFVEKEAKRQAELDVEHKKLAAEQQRLEEKKRQDHADAVADIKRKYSKSELTDADAEFIFKLKSFADDAKSLYDQQVNHYEEHERDEYSLDCVDDEDICSLGHSLDKLKDLANETSYVRGYNDGYADGYNGGGYYDDESSNIDYDLGYQSGSWEGGMDA